MKGETGEEGEGGVGGLSASICYHWGQLETHLNDLIFRGDFYGLLALFQSRQNSIPSPGDEKSRTSDTN